MQSSTPLFTGAIAGSAAASIIITSTSLTWFPIAGLISSGAIILSESGYRSHILRDSSGIEQVLALNGRILPEFLILLALVSTDYVPKTIGLLALGAVLYSDAVSLDVSYKTDLSYSRQIDRRVRGSILSLVLIGGFFSSAVFTWGLGLLVILTLYESVEANFRLASER